MRILVSGQDYNLLATEPSARILKIDCRQVHDSHDPQLDTSLRRPRSSEALFESVSPRLERDEEQEDRQPPAPIPRRPGATEVTSTPWDEVWASTAASDSVAFRSPLGAEALDRAWEVTSEAAETAMGHR